MINESGLLEARVQRLERRERLWRNGMGVMTIAMVCTILSAGQFPATKQQAEYESIRARRLAIVDGAGTERVVLRTIRDLEGVIEVLGSKGRPLVEIGEDGIGPDSAG